MSASQFTLDLTNDGFDDDNHNHNHNYNGTQSIRDFSEPMEQPQTQNVVATMNVSCRLDLKDIVTRSRNSEYNPKRFAAVVMRIREPKSTALIFQTGKIVITGARSENNAWIAARKYARILQKLDFPAQFRDFKIQNIVGSCDLGFPIRLEGLANQHSQFSSYEPELFPGLIYRMNQPKIVILSFVSGKIVLTGAKSNKQIINAFNKIYPILVQFRKDPNNHNHNDDDDDVDVDVDMYDDE